MLKEEIEKWQSDNIPDFHFDISEINEILSYEYSDFQNMNADNFFNCVWKLRKYSLHLKTEQNKISSRIKWIDNKLFALGKPLATGYPSYDKDERLYSAIKDNEFLKKIQDKKEEFQQQSFSIFELDKTVNYIVNMLEKMLYTKLFIQKDKSEGKI